MKAKEFVAFGKKIVAIGKNYEAHAREMGGTTTRNSPVLFLKPTTSYVRNGNNVLLPLALGKCITKWSSVW
ncbi:unnamed protein product [Hyaloperonospora brassicae]|uniref:Fumarylacetoacetase-like C-terminal domain-containing protein n=1 Tax=Hyaloperonospora brassicae TaxID=162125 RepID=A0AAV0U7R4_HYABA|nr:unnamed protein product [Hyaloperonospora brassicae]